ncbi:MAG: hypothetical protein IJW81_02485, partial [Clostridia bacterium]|nr:hypothetical protein [Clostridia bacterium]
MRIHTSSKTYEIPSVSGKSLFSLVSALSGVTTHTPCGGHGKCGKCICAVVYSGEPVPLTAAEAAFLEGADAASLLEHCRVPAELHETAVLRYLCLCPADDVTDVYLPDTAELTGAVFSDALAAGTPVVTAVPVSLTMPTLDAPTDTLTNLRSALGTDADIPMSAVCRVSAELRNGKTDFTTLVSGNRVIDVTTEPGAYAMLAIDIGTTTVALSLRDLKTGAELAGDVFGNPQRSSGGDVISRMSRAAAGEAELLKTSIRTAIAEHTKTLCERAG